MPLLEVRGLVKSFGGLTAVNKLDFNVNRGEIVGLIGPNGAGKTTVFDLITGFERPSSGTILFKGRDITNLQPNVVAALGVVRTFQSTTLYTDQTVLENVLMGHYLQRRSNLIASVLNSNFSRREDEEIKQRAMEILEYAGLAKVKDFLPGNLPYGHQRNLGLFIAMAASPELLLLDEPITGMNTEEALAVMNLIRGIHDRGVTILLVEHDMRAVMTICKRIIVLSFGRKIADGTPQDIKRNKEVAEVYLGDEWTEERAT